MFFKKLKSLQPSSRYFIISTGTFFAFVLFIVGVTKYSYVEQILNTSMTHEYHMEAQAHVGEILRLDEALTMSARLAAASGDLDWDARYRDLVHKLEQELLALKNTDPIAYEHFGGQETKEANDTLVKMELQALELVRKGRHSEAYDLLMSPRYKKTKDDYSSGMLRMKNVFQKRIGEEAAHLWRLGTALLQWIYFATIFFLSALIGSMVAAVMSIERNARVREQSEVIMNQMVLAGELSAQVNHEFKNIITILDFPIQNLKHSVGESAGQAAMANIEKIQSTFLRFTELIQAFGSLGRPSDLVMGPVAVEDAVRDVTYFASYLAEKKGIRFSVDRKYQGKHVLFQGNQLLLTQTLLNLVKNSCDAIENLSDDSRWVRLEIGEKQGSVQFRVVDGGKGLLGVVKKKLFQDRITTKGASGTGFGLNISRKFTVLQGGQLEYDDQGENTAFVVTLKSAA